MWTVVYIAPNSTMAEMLKNVLCGEGILVTLRAIGIPQLGETGAVEILVPESEVYEALEILNNSVH